MNTEKLLIEIQKAEKDYKEKSATNGSNFNLFWILGNEQNEIHHSAIIGTLLNPKDSHGQNDVYLKFFIEVIQDAFLNVGKTIPLNTQTSTLEIEKSIGPISNDYLQGGRIDLYLEDDTQNVLIIENKIFAQDQIGQLVRYNNYAKNYKKRAIILYLSPFGQPPNTVSIEFPSINESGVNVNDELKANEHFHIISYKIEIIEWLEKCIEYNNKQDLQKINALLIHYKEMIDYLTGNRTNKLTMDIEKQILENTDSSKLLAETYYKMLVTGIKALKNELSTEFDCRDYIYQMELGRFNEYSIRLYIEFYTYEDKPYFSIHTDKDVDAKIEPLADLASFLLSLNLEKGNNLHDFGFKYFEILKSNSDNNYLIKLNDKEYRKELIASVKKEIDSIKSDIKKFISEYK